MTAQVHRNKRQHPPTPIGKLLNLYAISLEQIKKCLVEEGVTFNSRSTLHRLVHGKLSHEMQEHLHPKLAKCLSKFLVARGLPKADIDAQLLAIFTTGEYKPMTAQRIELTFDECKWFGLAKDPFTAFPEMKEEVFISPPLKRVLDRLSDALRYPAFMAVTGEIGSGKDVVRAMVEEHVASSGNIHVIWPEFMDQSRISATMIARAILRHFGYGSVNRTKIPNRAEDLGNEVKRCLRREFRGGNRITIGFNECHRMNDSALSSLKNFFEMGSGGFQRWLSVLLIGQPSFAWIDRHDKTETLRGRLCSDQFRELAERVILVEMPGPAEFQNYAADYMAFRVEKAGGDIAKLFDRDAVDYITCNANTPQQLGNIANKAFRLSKEVFSNKCVIGSAIRTKMFFENREPTFFPRKNVA